MISSLPIKSYHILYKSLMNIIRKVLLFSILKNNKMKIYIHMKKKIGPKKKKSVQRIYQFSNPLWYLTFTLPNLESCIYDSVEYWASNTSLSICMIKCRILNKTYKEWDMHIHTCDHFQKS